MFEDELVRRAIDGNQQCLHILLETHYKTVYGFLIKMTGDLDLAQDLVQETLLKASLHISKFRGDCKFSTYLIQIALNLYRNEMRRGKRVTVMSDELLDQHFTSSTNMDSSIEFLEAMKTLQSMSYEQRMSFVLKHYYGYTIEEISTYFNVAPGTTKSRIHTAVQYLKKKLT